MSTLPPESTTTVVPDAGGVTRPSINAAAPTAPGSLDHELGPHEQHHDRIGDLVLADGDDLVDVPLDQARR